MIIIQGIGQATVSWHTDPQVVSQAIPISQVTSPPPKPGIYVKPSSDSNWAGFLTPETYNALINLGQLISQETCKLFIPKNSQWLICRYCNPGPPHPFDWSIVHPALNAVTSSWWSVNQVTQEAYDAYVNELVKNLQAIDWGKNVPEVSGLTLSNMFTWGLIGVGAFVVGRKVKEHWGEWKNIKRWKRKKEGG
jgi:hypothetical protein